MRLLTALVSLLLCAACTTPYRPPHIDPADAKIVGIHEVLAALPVGSPRSADVLLIHGMCHHDEGWVLRAIGNLAQTLGVPAPIGLSAPGRPIGKGAAMPALLYQEALDGADFTVRVFAILWSPVLSAPKQSLCYDVSTPTEDCAFAPYPHRRAYLNAIGKNWLMNGCLADAVAYVGNPSGPLIRGAVREGLKLALAGGRQSVLSDPALVPLETESAPLFVVSESLGSKILLDAALEESAALGPAGKRAFQRAISRTAQIYMGANQFPILSLGYTPVTNRSGRGDPVLRAFGDLYSGGRGTRLRIAAFSDPNDLLSYGLRRSNAVPENVDVVDVTVSNADTVFGLFEDPLEAHLGYRTNPDVRKLIACGTARNAPACR